MEANEAPEKIYVTNYDISALPKDEQLSDRWHEVSTQDTDIEYARTDAFIEKALAYLNDKFYFNNGFYGVVSTDFNSMEEMFEDFKNYMKGE